MFTVEMLPAQRGDCLWITYGTAAKKRHVLIDAGPQNVKKELIPELEGRIKALPRGPNRIELMVITHVDTDHIEGMVPLLTGERRLPLFRDVWFNGYQHLGPQVLGALQGEMVTEVLAADPKRWNGAFDNAAVVRPDAGPLPRVELPGGLQLIVIAPGTAALQALLPEWEQTCKKAGIVPGEGMAPPRSLAGGGLLGATLDVDTIARRKFSDDASKANRTSISLVATFEGKSVLLTGDASAGEINAGLDRLAAEGSVRVNGSRHQVAPTGATAAKPVHKFAAVKVSHHGSKNNTSLPLLERMVSKYWLLSSDGAKFHHPDDEALARIVVTQSKPVFVFNYARTEADDPSQRWIEAAQKPGAQFAVRYPKGKPGIVHRVS